MALQSNTQVYISGTQIAAFQEFNLHQHLGMHHTFELICRMDVLEKASLGGLAEDSKNYLGETLTFQASSVGDFKDYKTLEFKGIVTSVNSLKAYNHKNGDVIVISGHSTTIMAEDGPHYASHNDLSLQDILEKTFAGYDIGKLETAFEPLTMDPLHYSVQNNESSWQYAGRLAAQYSEWFYYDGKKLVFGKPEDGKGIALTYGHDLQEFSMELNPQPNNFNYFTNDYLTNEQHQKKTAEVAGASGYNGFASEKASKLYSKETNVFINGYNDPQLKKRLDKQVEQQKKAADQRQVILKGNSDNPGVGLGKVIKIKGQNEHYGSYRITKVSHSANENGRYQNNFEAVSAEMDVYPLTNFNATPKSGTQTATVVANADPEGMGRIQVQFAWQKPFDGMTPWLRIITPHSGGDKGFHFIPEIEEEVLVGFEGDNAERPYVMGSLYNGSGKAGAFQSEKNDIKALRTRSGHTVELNDTDGEEKIQIYDKDGSIIIFDTVKKSLTINATETVDIGAKNINLVAEENINLKAKGNIETASEGDTTVQSKGKSTVQATGDALVSSDAKVSLEAATDAIIKGQKIAAEAKTEAILKGMQTTVEGKKTLIQGASGKIDVV